MEISKEKLEQIVQVLIQWQKVEDLAIRNSTEIIKSVENPIVYYVMEIIRQDAIMHRRILQLIIDNIRSEDFSIEPEELEPLWSFIEEHNKLEKEAVQFAEKILENLDQQPAKYLMEYLLVDEQKHDFLLEKLNLFREKK
ncbi:MAG: hypothetical protein N2517_08480 [Ignavibacteria bacterium]|nr:hypothetical protein [Ignavibacteria bacterium]